MKMLWFKVYFQIRSQEEIPKLLLIFLKPTNSKAFKTTDAKYGIYFVRKSRKSVYTILGKFIEQVRNRDEAD